MSHTIIFPNVVNVGYLWKSRLTHDNLLVSFFYVPCSYDCSMNHNYLWNVTLIYCNRIIVLIWKSSSINSGNLVIFKIRVQQESPPAGNRKRRTDHGITYLSLTVRGGGGENPHPVPARGVPPSSPSGGSPSSPSQGGYPHPLATEGQSQLRGVPHPLATGGYPSQSVGGTSHPSISLDGVFPIGKYGGTPIGKDGILPH